MRLLPRQQHRVAQVRARDRVAQHLRQENALVDLQPVLVALVRCRIRAPAPWRPAPGRELLRRARAQLVRPHVQAALCGQRVVDAARVRAHEARARLAREREDLGRRRRFLRIALRLGRQAREQLRPSAARNARTPPCRRKVPWCAPGPCAPSPSPPARERCPSSAHHSVEYRRRRDATGIDWGQMAATMQQAIWRLHERPAVARRGDCQQRQPRRGAAGGAGGAFRSWSWTAWQRGNAVEIAGASVFAHQRRAALPDLHAVSRLSAKPRQAGVPGARPRGDLPPDRRDLHAVHARRAARRLGLDAVRPGLGHGARRHGR